MKYYRSRYKADGSTAIICNTECEGLKVSPSTTTKTQTPKRG